MTCRRIRDCFSEAFDGRLDGGASRDFESHLGACATCRTEYRRWRQIFTAVRDLPEVAMRRPAHAILARARLGAGLPPSRRGSGPLLPRPWAMAAGILLLITGSNAVVWRLTRSDRPLSPPPVFPSPAAAAGSAGGSGAMADPVAFARDHVNRSDLLLTTLARVPEDDPLRGIQFVQNGLRAARPEEQSRLFRAAIDDAVFAARRAELSDFAEALDRTIVHVRSGLAEADAPAERLRRVKSVVAASDALRRLPAVRTAVLSSAAPGRPAAGTDAASLEGPEDVREFTRSFQYFLGGDTPSGVASLRAAVARNPSPMWRQFAAAALATMVRQAGDSIRPLALDFGAVVGEDMQIVMPQIDQLEWRLLPFRMVPEMLRPVPMGVQKAIASFQSRHNVIMSIGYLVHPGRMDLSLTILRGNEVLPESEHSPLYEEARRTLVSVPPPR